MSKGLGMSIREVLYEHSYQQLLLFSSTLPTYDFDSSKKDDKWDDSLDANDPSNFDHL